MAKRTEIVEQWSAAGMPDRTPMTMIENAPLPQRRECRSVQGNMRQDVLGSGLKSATILVIGEIAATAGASTTHLLQA
ncbi:hypothetical protein [Pseudomonas sp. KCJK8993]|uniref:hypothetical protein n=1 Tax=Pseudomonas sp. KCJK8993 TaxID=3344565 RepID=UPI00390686DC